MQTEGHDDDLKGFVEKCYVWSLVFGWQQGVNARWLRGALKFETGQRRRPKLVTEASSAYGQEQSPTFFFFCEETKPNLHTSSLAQEEVQLELIIRSKDRDGGGEF
jgi:hypothetical protein